MFLLVRVVLDRIERIDLVRQLLIESLCRLTQLCTNSMSGLSRFLRRLVGRSRFRPQNSDSGDATRASSGPPGL